MRLDNWPAKTFESGRINQCRSQIIQRLQCFTAWAADLNHTIEHIKILCDCDELVAQRFAGKDQPAVPLILAFSKDPKHSIAILAAQIRSHMQREWKIDIETRNLL